MEEQNTKIYEQLADIQHRLKVGKEDWNDFSKFNYRNAETILSALKPMLAEHKLTLNMTEELEAVGNRYYVKSTVSLTDGKDFVSSTALAREEEVKKGMDASQITGSATSYARKYALGGLFAIDDGNDADGQDNTTKTTPKTASKAPAPKTTKAPTPKPKAYTQAQAQEIADLAKRLGYSDEIIEAKLSTIKQEADARIMIDKLNTLAGMEGK